MIVIIDYFDKKIYNVSNKVYYIGGKKMDRITSSLINQFSADFELQHLSDPTLFEYFCNYCAATNENGLDNIEIEEFSTGEATQGIDGIAIVVNGRFVYSIDDINELIRLNRTIRVKFILVQSKTSENFDNTQMLNFFHFAKTFFSDETDIFTSDEMKNFIELKNYIFDNATRLEKNPELVLYYCTVGAWQDDDNLVSIIEDSKRQLSNMALFSSIIYKMSGAEEIQNYFRKTFSELTATFKFEKKVVMYSQNEDEIGYCGVLPFSEFSKIILDDDNALKPVFEDNIRDFLGANTDVNKAIEETIASGDNNSFSQLNNGIMIVTSSSNLSGDIMTIRDYQIVNGCQTSHMLFEHPNEDGSINNLMIPIRIISTKNEELKNRITKATNNQTAIKKEQLEALSTFQKKLEEYYKTYTEPNEKIYYERRSGQYRNSNNILKSRIVTIPVQIKTVTAMFLNNPHGVSGQYGTIAKNVGNRLFKTADKSIIYYTSALALYRVETLLKSGAIDKKYWRTRYHAMMLLRLVVSDEDLPRFNARRMEQYCQKILDILNNEDLCKSYFSSIIDFIVNHTTLDIENRKTFERKDTTDFLISKIEEIKIFVSEQITQTIE